MEHRIKITAVYLFDWGDTLMVDFPGIPGKMCDWQTVEAIDGAEKALRFLSQHSDIYIATSAAESTEQDIRAAFKRVGLDHYLAGYFCKANLGLEKGTQVFLSAILEKLGVQPNQVTMVGDSFEKDIKPALALGINVVWLTKGTVPQPMDRVHVIASLNELYT